MRACALGLLALVSFAAPAAGQVDLLGSNGYPAWNGNAVQDLAHILTQKQEDSLRTLLAPARSQGVDLRVVTITSMSRYPVQATTIEDFAHGLFDQWRVGDRAQRDGVLLLVATEDRKLRIQLGDGVLHLEPYAQQVVDDSILPYFREGMRPRGILRGTAGIAQWFTADGAAYRAPATPQPAYAPAPAYSPPVGNLGPAAGWLILAFSAGLVTVVFVGLSAYARRRPRDCRQCGARMTRLDEVQDDLYLDSGQKLEELLASIDYDVWKCGSCGNHALLPYPRLFTSAGRCPSCSYRTAVTRTNVLQQPTYDWSGSKEVLRDCRNCGYHDRQVVYLPQLTRPSHHSSSWSSSSSSGSFSSSSSSSSSGGGGFSSGGGASGSW
ncbi:MAG TPA: TPM domain-containing protein [Longimicrobiaceae bacterium]|nr:TPM domain-containing protein [Longimicrobiaceae bacterium]